MIRAFSVVAAMSVSFTLAAQSVAITGGTVVTGDGQRIANATVVISGGRIQAVGAGLAAPAGAQVIDARGKFIYPGLINSRTTLGLTEISSVSGGEDDSEQGDWGPAFASIVAVNPHSELIPVTRVNGVTTVLSGPTGGRIAGMAALMDLDGWTPTEMARTALAALVVTWPQLEAGGGGGGFGGGGFGGGGGGALTPEQIRQRGERQVWELGEYIRSARSYHERAARGQMPPRDRHLEAMGPVVRGEVPMLVTANTADQIRSALAFADSLQVRLIIGGGRQAWRVAAELAQANVPVILGSILSSPGQDPFDAIYAQPAVLARAGVRIAFASWDASNARNLPYHAQMAVAHGLSPDTALMAMTSWPAAMWGVSDDIGTIAVGKVANLFIATGDPIDVRTQVEAVFIRGRAISMESRHTILYERFRARPRN
ncbi:MAG: amidohydrolase family protein [Gemmatimonadales bacterium]